MDVYAVHHVGCNASAISEGSCGKRFTVHYSMRCCVKFAANGSAPGIPSTSLRYVFKVCLESRELLGLRQYV